MAVETLTPLETVNSHNYEEVKQKAIDFYQQEHNLGTEERKQLYIFFEQQCRRMLLGFSVGVAIGVATPFIIRKKGSLVHPAFPVLGAVIGGSIVPGVVNNSIYVMQVENFKNKFGSESPIVKTILKTPDPITKSVFWSTYFKKSMNDPNFRLKDPTTIPPNSTKFFSFEEQPKIIPFGKPGYYKSNQEDSPSTYNEQYRSLEGWDKIRYEQSQPNSQSKNNINVINQQQNQPIRSIGDSYEVNESGELNVGSVFDNDGFVDDTQNNQNTNGSAMQPDNSDMDDPFKINKDHLIESQGSTGSAWERVRKGQ